MKKQGWAQCPVCGEWHWIFQRPDEPFRCTRCRRKALGLPERPRERHRRMTPVMDRAELQGRIESARAAKRAVFGCYLSADMMAVILGDKTMDGDNRKIKVPREPKQPVREVHDVREDHYGNRRIPCGGGYRVIKKRIGAK